jgi:hypothetical protein
MRYAIASRSLTPITSQRQGQQRLAVVVLSCLIALGCSFRVSQDGVYGTFVASYPFGTDTLTS